MDVGIFVYYISKVRSKGIVHTCTQNILITKNTHNLDMTRPYIETGV